MVEERVMRCFPPPSDVSGYTVKYIPSLHAGKEWSLSDHEMSP